MRILLALTLACLPLIYGQDAAVLKSVEPDYAKYSPDLATDFETAVTPVTVTVQANGKPLAFNSIPLPMAVVMALKDYEFQPQGTITVPHGRIDAVMGGYEVKLNVPIRQGKYFVSPDEISPQDPASADVIVAGPDGKPAVRSVRAIRIGAGIAKGMVVRRVQPVYPEDAKEARIQGTVTLEAMISKQGYSQIRRIVNGPFALIEAAYDAVRQWQYRPYLMNHEPVEGITEIEVVFNLN
jgi:TonB family protein